MKAITKPVAGFLGKFAPPDRGDALPRAAKPPSKIETIGDLFPLSPRKQSNQTSTNWRIGSKHFLFRGTEVEYHYVANLIVHHSDDSLFKNLRQIAINASAYKADVVLRFSDSTDAEFDTGKQRVFLNLSEEDDFASFKECAAHTAANLPTKPGKPFNSDVRNTNSFIPSHRMQLPRLDARNRIAENGFALKRMEFPTKSKAASLPPPGLGEFFVVQPHFSDGSYKIGGKNARLRFSGTREEYDAFANLMLRYENDHALPKCIRYLALDEQNGSPIIIAVSGGNQTALRRDPAKPHATNVIYNLDEPFGCLRAAFESVELQAINTSNNIALGNGKKSTSSIAELSNVGYNQKTDRTIFLSAKVNPAEAPSAVRLIPWNDSERKPPAYRLEARVNERTLNQVPLASGAPSTEQTPSGTTLSTALRHADSALGSSSSLAREASSSRPEPSRRLNRP